MSTTINDDRKDPSTLYTLLGSSSSDLQKEIEEVQQEQLELKRKILALVQGPDGKTKKNMNTAALMSALYGLVGFGDLQTRVGALTSDMMNGLRSDLSVLWQKFNASGTAAGGGKDGHKIFMEFKETLRNMRGEIMTSKFFTEGSGKSVQAELLSTLDTLDQLTNPNNFTDPRAKANPLWGIWVEYDPSIDGKTGAGNPGKFDSYNRTSGTLTSTINSTSQVVDGNIKADMKSWEAEQQTLMNFLKSLEHQIDTYIRGTIPK